MSHRETDFDEEWYLRSYPDVARAVAAGHVRSGYQHYLEHGRAEGRLARPAAEPAAEPGAETAAETGAETGAEPGARAVPHSLTPLPASPAADATRRHSAPELKPLIGPPVAVELSASDAQIEAMLDRVKRNFEFMGEREPHWSVLSAERYLARNIESTEDEFFQSGRHPVDELSATAARCGVRLGRAMTCFELGSGLGRSTIWLADLFGQVTGADISVPHLGAAARTARRFGKTNASFVHIDRPDLIEAMPPFDVFFSIIVLQHNPPPVIARYLSAILRKLKPGGLAYFQIPTYRLGYEFDSARYLGSQTVLGMPEMHIVPQPYLYRLFEQSGCRPVEIREDGAAGDNHVSHRFFIEKLA